MFLYLIYFIKIMSLSNILISNLHPPQSISSNSTPSTTTPISFSIKLTNDFINLLKNHSTPNNKIKLIVKNSNISIKLSDDLIFPCLPLPENLTVDIYSIPSNNQISQFDGRIINKLTVITDAKKIKEINTTNSIISTSNSKINSRLTPSLLIPSSPINNQRSTYSIYSNVPNNPYKISLSKDSNYIIVKKLIHLLALGPITYNHIVKLLDYSKFDSILDDYGQVYNDQDQFIQEDRFPYIDSNNTRKNDDDEEEDDEVQRFILKDRSYKELRPWKWNYTSYERNSILNNVNNALTRIGFSQSHPLRRKIVEPPNENDKEVKKPNISSLGGGFLISSTSSKKKSTPTPIPSKSNTPVVPTPTPAPAPTSSSSSFSKINSPMINSISAKTDTPVIRPPSRNINNTPSPSSKLKLNNNNNNNDKRKFSSSSSSSEDDDSKKLNYTSPPSSEEESAGGTSSSSTTTNTNGGVASNSNNETIYNNKDSKLEYYTNLATKFKIKYKEYSELYNSLLTKNDIKPMDYKENLLKLFKLHQNLSQWKKILWNFDKEIKSKNTLSGLHIEKNTTINNTNNTNSNADTNTSPAINLSPSNTVIDAHPPGIRTATPFKRRKVMDY